MLTGETGGELFKYPILKLDGEKGFNRKYIFISRCLCIKFLQDSQQEVTEQLTGTCPILTGLGE